MAYCVHTICIETGFKLHFATTYNSSNIKKGSMQTYFGGKWIVPISMKTIKNELVRSRKIDMHEFYFQYKCFMVFLKRITWHVWPKHWAHFFSDLKYINDTSFTSNLGHHHHNPGCNLCGKSGNHSDIISSWSSSSWSWSSWSSWPSSFSLQFVWKVG